MVLFIHPLTIPDQTTVIVGPMLDSTIVIACPMLDPERVDPSWDRGPGWSVWGLLYR